MRIRFVRPWQGYRPGQEIDMACAGAGEVLVNRRLAVEVKPPAASETIRPLAPKRR